MGTYGIYKGRRIVEPPNYNPNDNTFSLTLEGGNKVIMAASKYLGAGNGVHRRTSPEVPSNPPQPANPGHPGPGPSDTGEGAGERTSEARIRAGEITAYRMWRVVQPGQEAGQDYRLQSVARMNIWHPGEPMTGRPGLINPEDPFSPHLQGVYSYKSTEGMIRNGYYRDILWSNATHWNVQHASQSRPYQIEHVVFGSVEIWGEVHEYTLGYLSEYGRVTGFSKSVKCNPESISEDEMLKILHQTYMG